MYNKNSMGEITAQKPEVQSEVKILYSDLRFKYDDDSRGLFDNWDDLLNFWSPYYGGKAGADRHFRTRAYGCICDKWGYAIAVSEKNGPLNSAERSELMASAIKDYSGRPVEIGIQR